MLFMSSGPKIPHLASVALLLISGSLANATDGELLVSADGSGRYKTIQEAVAAVPDRGPGRTTILIKPGIYEGPIVIPAVKTKLVFRGGNPANTVITWNRNVKDALPPGANAFNPGLHLLADDFRAENLTIQNTSGDHGQAVAMRADADHAVFKNCRLLGWQDTLMLNKGRYYFQGCHIEGRVDFIYGNGTAVFDRCRIHSKNGGYITAASTPQDHPFGFVFLRCTLTGDPAPWIDPKGEIPPNPSPNPLAYLGRPWRQYASVAFIECEIGSHVRPEGWHNWLKPDYETSVRYTEFANTGPGARPEGRVAWARQLRNGEAELITVRAVLGGADHWRPDEHFFPP